MARRLGTSEGAVANAITAAEIARHVGVLTHDSMLGRDTSSRRLELAARYGTDQFRALGLEPAGDRVGWVQHYSIPGHSSIDYAASTLIFKGAALRGSRPVGDEDGSRVELYPDLNLATTAVVADDTLLDFRAPGARGGGQGAVAAFDVVGPAAAVVAGRHTIGSIQQANHDKVVGYVPAADADTALQHHIVQPLHAANYVMVVPDEDSAAFARRRDAARRHPPVGQQPNRVAADINLGQIGRLAGDTLLIAGCPVPTSTAAFERACMAESLSSTSDERCATTDNASVPMR